MLLNVIINGTSGSRRRAKIACIALLAAAAIIQYAYAIGNDFVWDAGDVFINDPSIREWRFLPSAFSEEFQKHIPIESSGEYRLKYYRPLVKVIHIVEFHLFGGHPAGYHAVNVLLNAAVVILAFLVVLSFTENLPAAFLSALLYAVNPTRIEVVAWAYSDSYLYAACFSLLALLAHHNRKRTASAVLFSLSLLCHESSILLMVIIPLYELLVRRSPLRDGALRTVPYGIIAVVFLLVRRLVVGEFPLSLLDPATVLMTVAVIIKRSVKIFFLPDAPVALYQNELFSQLTPEVALSGLIVILLLLVALSLAYAGRQYLFWYLWFFVWLAITFNVGKFGAFLMAEKLLFLASLGLTTVLALLATSAVRYRRAAVAGMVALVLVHGTITFSRLPYWRDTRTYLEKVLEFSPDHYLFHYNLGNIYAAQGEYRQAIQRYEDTIRLVPGHSHAYANLGNVYYRQGDGARAVTAWENAALADPRNPIPYYNLGLMRENAGDTRDAMRYYRQYLSLERHPSDAAVRHIRELENAVR